METRPQAHKPVPPRDASKPGNENGRARVSRDVTPMKRRLAGLWLLALALPVQAASPARDARWREDLKFLASELPQRHVNLFFELKREDFERAVAELDRRIPELSDAEVAVGMMRIVAMAGDSHASIASPFRTLAIGLRWFQDGLFVTAVAHEHREALGGRVVQIGDLGVDQASEVAKTVISHENDAGPRQQSASLLAMAEVLYALRITPRPELARYVVERNGGARLSIEVAAGPATVVQGGRQRRRTREGDHRAADGIFRHDERHHAGGSVRGHADRRADRGKAQPLRA